MSRQRDLDGYLDSYNLVVQKDGDGGDTANKMGLLGVAAYFLNDQDLKDYVREGLPKLIVDTNPYKLVRNPTPNIFWSDPNHFSRDQQSAVVLGASLVDKKLMVFNIMLAHLMRYGAYQNFQFKTQDVSGKTTLIKGDIASPEHLGYYARALDAYHLYPLLYIADLFMLLNSIVIVVKSYLDPDDTSNDLNHIAALLFTKVKQPTLMSWLARQVYVRLRANAGKDKQSRLPGFAPQTALDHYFREETGAPPINEFFKPFLEKELK